MLPYPVASGSTHLLPITHSNFESIAERLVAIYDPKAARMFSFFEKPLTQQREKGYLLQMCGSKTDELFAIVLGGEGVVGTTGLHEIDERRRDARLGILIWNRAFHGKGVGSAAIRLLLEYAFLTRRHTLCSVYLATFLNNMPAQKLYCRCGFFPEIVLRAAYMLCGEAYDMLRMRARKSKWLSKYGKAV